MYKIVSIKLYRFLFRLYVNCYFFITLFIWSEVYVYEMENNYNSKTGKSM